MLLSCFDGPGFNPLETLPVKSYVPKTARARCSDVADPCCLITKVAESRGSCAIRDKWVLVISRGSSASPICAAKLSNLKTCQTWKPSWILQLFNRLDQPGCFNFSIVFHRFRRSLRIFSGCLKGQLKGQPFPILESFGSWSFGPPAPSWRTMSPHLIISSFFGS